MKIDNIYVASLIWEWGFIGLAIWTSIFFKVMSFSSKLENNVFGIWFIGVLTVTFIGAVYNTNLFVNILGYYFWTLAGIVVREYYEQKNKKNKLTIIN